MAVVEKFLGKRVDIPEDRRYVAAPGLWVKPEGQSIVFGLTQPALVLVGGINDLDWIVPNGQNVSAGDTIIFCITGKILYIDTPVSGRIQFNADTKQRVSLVNDDPYGDGWLFSIEPDQPGDRILTELLSTDEYVRSLKKTEGFKNPDGLKGGISEICKAVYSGIRQQKL